MYILYNSAPGGNLQERNRGAPAPPQAVLAQAVLAQWASAGFGSQKEENEKLRKKLSKSVDRRDGVWYYT